MVTFLKISRMLLSLQYTKRKVVRQSVATTEESRCYVFAGKILTKILFSRLLNNVAHHALPESQCGFRPNRGTADMIFAARQLQEKCREQNKDLYTVFVDLSKAFDTVNRDGLWTVLRRFGCTERFTRILQSLHNGMLGRVRVDGVLSEAFPISNGVRKG